MRGAVGLLRTRWLARTASVKHAAESSLWLLFAPADCAGSVVTYKTHIDDGDWTGAGGNGAQPRPFTIGPAVLPAVLHAIAAMRPAGALLALAEMVRPAAPDGCWADGRCAAAPCLTFYAPCCRTCSRAGEAQHGHSHQQYLARGAGKSPEHNQNPSGQRLARAAGKLLAATAFTLLVHCWHFPLLRLLPLLLWCLFMLHLLPLLALGACCLICR